MSSATFLPTDLSAVALARLHLRGQLTDASRPQTSLENAGARRKLTDVRHGPRPRSEGSPWRFPPGKSPPSRTTDTPCRLVKTTRTEVLSCRAGSPWRTTLSSRGPRPWIKVAPRREHFERRARVPGTHRRKRFRRGSPLCSSVRSPARAAQGLCDLSRDQHHVHLSMLDPAWKREAGDRQRVGARPLGIRGVWAPTVVPDGPLRS